MQSEWCSSAAWMEDGMVKLWKTDGKLFMHQCPDLQGASSHRAEKRGENECVHAGLMLPSLLTRAGANKYLWLLIQSFYIWIESGLSPHPMRTKAWCHGVFFFFFLSKQPHGPLLDQFDAPVLKPCTAISTPSKVIKIPKGNVWCFNLFSYSVISLCHGHSVFKHTNALNIASLSTVR